MEDMANGQLGRRVIKHAGQVYRSVSVHAQTRVLQKVEKIAKRWERWKKFENVNSMSVVRMTMSDVYL